MDRRKSANIDFRLNRFEQKIAIWGTQLKQATYLNVREMVEIIRTAVLPSVLYGLEFSQNLDRSRGKIRRINAALARFA